MICACDVVVVYNKYRKGTSIFIDIQNDLCRCCKLKVPLVYELNRKSNCFFL